MSCCQIHRSESYHCFQPQKLNSKKDNMKLIDCPPKNGCNVSRGEDLLANERRSFVVEDLLQELEGKPFNLALISEFVRRNREKRLLLQGDRKWYIRLCDLDGTTYMGQTHMLQSWQKLYLSQPIKMQVLGVLGSCSSMLPFPQWVILVGEDSRVYAYGDEELTLVANTLRKLEQSGLDFTGPTYSYPDVSDEDEEELQKDPVIQKIRQSTDDFIEQSADDCDDFFEYYDS